MMSDPVIDVTFGNNTSSIAKIIGIRIAVYTVLAPKSLPIKIKLITNNTAFIIRVSVETLSGIKCVKTIARPEILLIDVSDGIKKK